MPALRSGETAGYDYLHVDLGFGVIVVRQVPALLCSQCGEAWIEGSVAARLQELVDTSRRNPAVVQVIQREHVAA